MTDFLFMDEIAEFIKCQRVPRLLYKKGMCTEGYFTPYMNLSDHTKAKFLTDTEARIPVTVRFSKVFSEYGASDTKRDAAGFFVRFFTEEGRFDMLAHSIPIPEEIRNPKNIIKLIETFKKKDDSSAPDDKAIFELAASDEAFIPFIMRYFSDDTTIKSYRNIMGYAMNDYTLVNDAGERRSVSFVWRPASGKKNISRQEAEFLAGYDSSAAMRDMADAIFAGKYPEYDLEMYTAHDEGGTDAAEGEIMTVGRLTIDAVADSCASEEIGFTPLNVVPGIELADNEFNNFTAFAFNESARVRGGMR